MYNKFSTPEFKSGMDLFRKERLKDGFTSKFLFRITLQGWDYML